MLDVSEIAKERRAILANEIGKLDGFIEMAEQLMRSSQPEPDEAPERTAARLRGRGVCVVVRRGGVRASPHFYNDEAEIDALLAAL